MAKRRILIVAEEIKWAIDLEARLTQLGYEVAAIAASEKEAIEIRSRGATDLVLMDIAVGGVVHVLRAAGDIQERT